MFKSSFDDNLPQPEIGRRMSCADLRLRSEVIPHLD